MRVSTQHNHVTRILDKVRSIMTRQTLSADQQLESLKIEVFGDPLWLKLPRHCHARVHGAIGAFTYAAHLFQALKWCHEWKGMRYEKFDELPEEAKELVRSGKEVPCYHYWVKTGVRYSLPQRDKEVTNAKAE
jgi:hypothetical protein